MIYLYKLMDSQNLISLTECTENAELTDIKRYISQQPPSVPREKNFRDPIKKRTRKKPMSLKVVGRKGPAADKVAACEIMLSALLPGGSDNAKFASIQKNPIFASFLREWQENHATGEREPEKRAGCSGSN